MPKTSVSLVITSYNRAHYLKEALESILNQTLKEFTLILYDDGSKDNSLELANDYAKQDSRIKVFSGQNIGTPGHLKHAFDLALQDNPEVTYLGWMDCDDKLAPTCLEETKAILDSLPSVGMVYSDYLDMTPDGKLLGKGYRCKKPYSKNRLLIEFMTFHFHLMRREIYQQAGGVDLRAICAEDYDLCLKISELTEIYHLQRPLYYYRQHPENISTQKRLEQIVSTGWIIDRALKRRGLDQTHLLNLELVSRFGIRPKTEQELADTKQIKEPNQLEMLTRLLNLEDFFNP